MDILVIKSFIPEIFLSLSILFLLIYNVEVINKRVFNHPLINKEIFSQTVVILFCTILLFCNLKIEGYLSNFLLVNDEGSRLCKIVSIIFVILILPTILESFTTQKLNFFEFFVIFLLSFFSLLLLISCSDLISFYIVLEMQSLCFYILACFKRDSIFSAESAIKYFIAGSFISGFFLFGSSILYGSVGTLNFNHLAMLFSFPMIANNSFLYLLINAGLILITGTLLFKLSCAPFHFWSPDVYDGAPLSSTIIFSIIPKISLLFFLIKWICCLDCLLEETKTMLFICGLTSVSMGTFAAFMQNRLKKLMIYSSIAQMGFMICVLALNDLSSYISLFFFLIIYLLTSILIWSQITVFYSFQSITTTFNNRKLSSFFLSSMTNFFKHNPLWSFSLVILFFSSAGIPPLTGFLTKVSVISEFALRDSTVLGNILGFCLLILSCISAFYYIRFIKVTFFEPKQKKINLNEKFQTIYLSSILDRIYLVISTGIFTLIIVFIKPESLLLVCQYIVLYSSFY